MTVLVIRVDTWDITNVGIGILALGFGLVFSGLVGLLNSRLAQGAADLEGRLSSKLWRVGLPLAALGALLLCLGFFLP